jgi:hypothetical protein
VILVIYNVGVMDSNNNERRRRINQHQNNIETVKR